MIAKQIKGTSFRGVLRYLHEKEGAELLGGNMVGRSPRTLSSEFCRSRQQNRRVQKAVFHASLSLPKTESLESETWLNIAQDYLHGMGFQGCQYVVYRHTDQDHDHIHMVASRIRMVDGKTVSDSWDYRRGEQVVRQLEQAYQLAAVVPSWEQEQRASTTGECRLMERTGETSVRKRLHVLLDELAGSKVQMPRLIEQLQRRGVSVKVWFTSAGKARGISYELDDVAFSGSKLGKAYTFPGLQKHRGVEYEPEQDNPIIRELMERDVATLPPDEAMPIEMEMATHAPNMELNAATENALESEVQEDAQPEVILHIAPKFLAEEPEREKEGQKGEQIPTTDNFVRMSGINLDDEQEAARVSVANSEEAIASENAKEESSLTSAFPSPEMMGDRETCPTPFHNEYRPNDSNQQFSPPSLKNPQDHTDLPSLKSEPLKEQTLVPLQFSPEPLSKKQYYQQLWEHYSQTVQVSNPVKRDGVVARRAFRNGVSRKDIALMLVTGSPYVKELDEKRGRAIATNYVNRITENITGQSQRQIVQKRRVRELER